MSANPNPADPRRGTLLCTVGAQVRDARQRAGLAQADVARSMNWTSDAVSKLERGVIGTSLFNALRLVSILRDTWPDAGDPLLAAADKLLPEAPTPR